jgi:hypothetical protein
MDVLQHNFISWNLKGESSSWLMHAGLNPDYDNDNLILQIGHFSKI